MKRFITLIAVVAAIVLSTASFSSGSTPSAETPQEHGKEHGAGFRQYDAFHEVLHPLQHEALPGKDFRRIRSKSALLAKRGDAIVRLGMPRGVSDANKAEFHKELSKFRRGIAKFRTDARRGTDAQLEASFSALHDSFEMLMSMLPRS